MPFPLGARLINPDDGETYAVIARERDHVALQRIDQLQSDEPASVYRERQLAHWTREEPPDD